MKIKRSVRYADLRRSLRELRGALLPRYFNPTGTYRRASSVHLRSVSFRVLMHAEIEEYIEDRALELASASWVLWQKKRLATDPIVGLVCFSGLESKRPPGKLGGDPSAQGAYEDLGKILDKANAVWRHEHKNNHGVKEANVLSLLLPLGIDPSTFDSTLMADLSSYGEARGKVAHSSSRKMTVLLDPAEEFKKAKQLVDSLEALDFIVGLALLRIAKTDETFP